MRNHGPFLAAALAAGVCLPAYADGVHTAPASQPAATAPALVSAPKRADEYLTLEQLVQAYRQKQYSLLVRESQRVLSNPKLQVDRFSILVLQAESQLQLKGFAAAVRVFKAAANEAPDDDKRALMNATAALVLHRTGLTYIPKTTDVYGNLSSTAGPAPGRPAPSIDLLDLSQRQNALRALFWDEFVPLRRKIQQAHSMREMQDNLAALREVSTLEAAAGAQQSETKKLREEAATVSEAIMSGTVAGIIKQMKREVATSRETEPVPLEERTDVQQNGQLNGRPGRRWRDSNDQPETRLKGFSAAAMDRIHALTDYLDKVPNTVDELVKELHTDKKPFEPLLKQAESTKNEIRDIVDSYSRSGLLR
jgi:hypothetical protein